MIDHLAEQLRGQPTELSLLQQFEVMVGLARSLPFEVDLWKAQNIFFDLQRQVYPDLRERAEKGDEEAKIWVGNFLSLAEKLNCRLL